MVAAFLQVQSPHIAQYQGKPTTSSQDVASYFGKQHRDVLRAIRTLIEDIVSSQTEGLRKIAQSSTPEQEGVLQSEQSPDPDALKPELVEAPAARNFVLVEYENEQGKMQPAYRMDRDGFTLLAMGFTGKEALKFKLAYIDAFNRMEEELRLQRLAAAPNPFREMLERGRYIVQFEGPGVFSLTEVGRYAAIVDPYSEKGMRQLVTMASPDMLQTLLKVGIERLAERGK